MHAYGQVYPQFVHLGLVTDLLVVVISLLYSDLPTSHSQQTAALPIKNLGCYSLQPNIRAVPCSWATANQ